MLGVYDTRTKKTTLNPPVSRKLKGRDMLVMMRPTSVGKNDYKPMAEAVDVDMGAPFTRLTPSCNTCCALMFQLHCLLSSIMTSNPRLSAQSLPMSGHVSWSCLPWTLDLDLENEAAPMCKCLLVP